MREAKEKEYFIENLVMLSNAGMDILSILDNLLQEIKSPSFQKKVQHIRNDINEGLSVAESFERAKFFKPYVISLLRIGERSGKLFQNLNVVANEQRKERAFRSKVRSALMYPLFILGVAAVVGVGVAWFVLPNLAQVFSRMDIALPAITKAVIWLGFFLGSYGTIVIPLVIISLGIIAYMLFVHGSSKWLGQSILFSVPGIRDIIQNIELARIGYIVGTLLNAGIPLTDTLLSLEQTTDFAPYRRLYMHLKESIEKGLSFHAGFTSFKQSSRLIPSPIQQMISAGEQSGRLSEAFLHLGVVFEEKTDTATKDIAVLLEPLLLVVVWIGVVGIALAVIMPIYNLIGGFNK